MSVVKRQQVRSADPCRLGGRDGGWDASQPATSAAAPASVRIVQQDANGSLLEIVCPCGHVIRLNCLYAEGSGSSTQA
jgi:hypothetical protein